MRLVSRLREVLCNPAMDRSLRLRVGRLITTIDPMNEEACRDAMRAFSEIGEVSASLRVYDRIYELLDEEMGMEPSAETQALVVAIKSGELGQAPAPAPARPVAAPKPQIITPRTGPPRIAIMPFADLGPTPTPTYFCEGIRDDTVAQLVRL